MQKKNAVNHHKEAQLNEEARKQYNKRYSDLKRNVKEITSIKAGDTVLVRQDRKNKLTANFDETPYTVSYQSKSQAIARNKDCHMIT